MYSNESPAVVIDNGSGLCKAGICGDDFPSVSIPTIVGQRNLQSKAWNMNDKPYYFGKDALENRSILDIKYPIQRGIITDWDSMEKLWHHCIYDKLKASPEEHTFLISERICVNIQLPLILRQIEKKQLKLCLIQ